MHQDALHELMENFRRQLLILQFRFHLWDVRFTLLLLCMARNPLCC